MPGPVETRSVSPVFVGRAGRPDTLKDALVRADAAEPQALLLGGAAGVGKTRLVEEFATAAHRPGAVHGRTTHARSAESGLRWTGRRPTEALCSTHSRNSSPRATSTPTTSRTDWN
ncbi:ATP-binding protein [Streptomyces sp. WG7]|uniref:ATP-binding protein n=1 Tax=Streptomyces sp. WG7 TaxID=3417650 RepID=UPI003CF597B8